MTFIHWLKKKWATIQFLPPSLSASADSSSSALKRDTSELIYVRKDLRDIKVVATKHWDSGEPSAAEKADPPEKGFKRLLK